MNARYDNKSPDHMSTEIDITFSTSGTVACLSTAKMTYPLNSKFIEFMTMCHFRMKPSCFSLKYYFLIPISAREQVLWNLTRAVITSHSKQIVNSIVDQNITCIKLPTAIDFPLDSVVPSTELCS